MHCSNNIFFFSLRLFCTFANCHLPFIQFSRFFFPSSLCFECIYPIWRYYVCLGILCCGDANIFGVYRAGVRALACNVMHVGGLNAYTIYTIHTFCPGSGGSGVHGKRTIYTCISNTTFFLHSFSIWMAYVLTIYGECVCLRRNLVEHCLVHLPIMLSKSNIYRKTTNGKIATTTTTIAAAAATYHQTLHSTHTLHLRQHWLHDELQAQHERITRQYRHRRI